MSDIKPRYDEDGVPWCDADCPHNDKFKHITLFPMWCVLSEMPMVSKCVCPHAVKELAKDKARLDALESSYLSGCAVVSDENGHFAVTVSRWTSPSGALENEWPVEVMFLIDEDELFDSIRAAIDAAREDDDESSS